MNIKDIYEAKDPLLRSSLTALRRAAALARREAIQTGVDLVVVVDGRLVFIEAKTLQQQAGSGAGANP
jgi:hypothetical protein